MKTPSYEPSVGQLAAFLASNLQAIPVDLFTITLPTATVLRYTGGDVPEKVNALSYALGPRISRSRVSRSVGIVVDKLDVVLGADSTVTVAGEPIIKALARGAFAGGTLRLERLFKDASRVVQGVLPVFFGRIGEVSTGLNRAKIEVRSHAELLDVMVPAEVYQPGCRNTLFDLRCKLARGPFLKTPAATVGSTATRTTFSTANFGSGGARLPSTWFDMGTVKFTSGANAGFSRTVKRHVQNGLTQDDFTVIAPFPFAIAIGDTMQLYPGCDKTRATCASSKFNNLSNFRAEPYIPAPETVV